MNNAQFYKRSSTDFVIIGPLLSLDGQSTIDGFDFDNTAGSIKINNVNASQAVLPGPANSGLYSVYFSPSESAMGYMMITTDHTLTGGRPLSAVFQGLHADAYDSLVNGSNTLPVVGANMPRVNYPPGSSFDLQLSTRADGTYGAHRPVRLLAGAVGLTAVGIDVSPVYGDARVTTVGTPTVSGGSITATALGPRDDGPKRQIMVELGGTATASESREISVPFTLETGESDIAWFNVEVSDR